MFSICGCVRDCFESLGSLYPELIGRNIRKKPLDIIAKLDIFRYLLTDESDEQTEFNSNCIFNHEIEFVLLCSDRPHTTILLIISYILQKSKQWQILVAPKWKREHSVSMHSFFMVFIHRNYFFCKPKQRRIDVRIWNCCAVLSTIFAI